MAGKPDNAAAESTPARTYKERLEQALLWAMYELERDQSGHSGLIEAVEDIVPEFSSFNLTSKKNYPLTWPQSYDDDA
ncbi:hypothetical protein [Vibrio parahaemolyticus]|uniref:hypothetical protein n=1 Tax=Vibrio parahaemolyticus TaxID=670 RepID=UPI0004DF1589|nr:hypothetical protein [Vibrio parahaemolyticus]